MGRNDETYCRAVATLRHAYAAWRRAPACTRVALVQALDHFRAVAQGVHGVTDLATPLRATIALREGITLMGPESQGYVERMRIIDMREHIQWAGLVALIDGAAA